MSKAVLTNLCLAAGLLAGCETGPKPAAQVIKPAVMVTNLPPETKPTTQASAGPADVTIANVGSTKVGRNELVQPLLEAYGFNFLMLVVQRDMARDACQQAKITVTPADIKWEYDWTLGQMFPNLSPGDDKEKVLDQFLAQPKPHDQTSTRTELNIIIDTNAHLRKLVEPKINTAITDAMLQEQFDEEYGAQVLVRDIVVSNPQEAAAVTERLNAGEDFATLARQISRDPTTKRQGGELPPFSINSTRVPENFKRVAFSLKPGQVSDPVEASGGYHLLKLEQRIAPKAVKFADVKDSLKDDYRAKLVVEAVKGVRGELAKRALAQLSISDPTLKMEFDSRLAARDQMIRDRQKINEQMEKDRAKAATPAPPATAPAATPAPAPAAPPAAAPATKPVPAPASTGPSTGPSSHPS